MRYVDLSSRLSKRLMYLPQVNLFPGWLVTPRTYDHIVTRGADRVTFRYIGTEQSRDRGRGHAKTEGLAMIQSHHFAQIR